MESWRYEFKFLLKVSLHFDIFTIVNSIYECFIPRTWLEKFDVYSYCPRFTLFEKEMMKKKFFFHNHLRSVKE